jgi:hypothetical protein
MKKIKIIRSRPLKEEEVVDQQSVEPTAPAITFESDPLEFLLMKYPSLKKTMIDLLTVDFKDYLNGIYIMAPKPTTFKVVLHNNRPFYLTFLGDDKFSAKVEGKKYYLATLSDLERATVAIANVLTLGAPKSAEGPDQMLPSTPEEKPSEEKPAEEAPTEEKPEELKEGKLKLRIVENTLDELAKLSYDILTPEAQDIAQQLIKKLKIGQDQIQPASKTNIVIYDDNRSDLVAKTAALKTFGQPTDKNAGDFKVGKVKITFKPYKTSGEFYELKPQNLGVTLDEFISLDQLKKELIRGIKNHPVLDGTQKQYLLDLINGKDTLSPEQKAEIKNNKYFFNEVLKNLGEVLGAMLYAKEIGATQVFFPKAGNYPLVDYILRTPKGDVRVSAKTAKGQGNIVKPQDLNNIIKQRKGKISPEKQEILDILSTSNGKSGSLNLIPKFGDSKLNKDLKAFLKKYPNYDSKGGQYDPAERIALERQIIKQINENPALNFSDEFNKYVSVRYVKYNMDVNSVTGKISVVKNFDVNMSTKNSPGHDGERIGFSLGKSA